MTLYWPTISEQIVTPTGTYLYDRGPNHVPRYHQGCDIRVPVGTPIYASGEGVVTGVFNTGNHSGFGRYVQVQYGTLQVRTAHMSSANVIVGQRVVTTTLLGLSGGKAGSDGAGDSTGPHCHLETHNSGVLTNPQLWLAPRTGGSGGGEEEEMLNDDDKAWMRECIRQEVAAATKAAQDVDARMMAATGGQWDSFDELVKNTRAIKLNTDPK